MLELVATTFTVPGVFINGDADPRIGGRTSTVTDGDSFRGRNTVGIIRIVSVAVAWNFLSGALFLFAETRDLNIRLISVGCIEHVAHIPGRTSMAFDCGIDQFLILRIAIVFLSESSNTRSILPSGTVDFDAMPTDLEAAAIANLAVSAVATFTGSVFGFKTITRAPHASVIRARSSALVGAASGQRNWGRGGAGLRSKGGAGLRSRSGVGLLGSRGRLRCVPAANAGCPLATIPAITNVLIARITVCSMNGVSDEESNQNGNDASSIAAMQERQLHPLVW
jgi:hypothetical protein